MAELKTKPTGDNVTDFLNSVKEDQKRHDSLVILELMKKITGAEPKMWGPSMIGFDTYHYKYPSGREGDWFLTGFSPRKQNLTIYLMPGIDSLQDLLEKLGKHKTGKGCLYFKKLEEIDLGVLEELIKRSIDHLKKRYT